MDRVGFDILDQGYQEDKKRLIAKMTQEVAPEFDERLRVANQNYVQRLWNIRNSNYTHVERQRLEQQELEAYEARQASIEAEREQEVQDRAAPQDTQLQMLAFEGRMRDEAEAIVVRQENEQAQSIEDNPEQEEGRSSTFNAASGDYADVSDFAHVDTDEAASSLSSDFSESAQVDVAPPTKDGGIEH